MGLSSNKGYYYPIVDALQASLNYSANSDRVTGKFSVDYGKLGICVSYKVTYNFLVKVHDIAGVVLAVGGDLYILFITNATDLGVVYLDVSKMKYPPKYGNVGFISARPNINKFFEKIQLGIVACFIDTGEGFINVKDSDEFKGKFMGHSR